MKLFLPQRTSSYLPILLTLPTCTSSTAVRVLPPLVVRWIVPSKGFFLVGVGLVCTADPLASCQSVTAAGTRPIPRNTYCAPYFLLPRSTPPTVRLPVTEGRLWTCGQPAIWRRPLASSSSQNVIDNAIPRWLIDKTALSDGTEENGVRLLRFCARENFPGCFFASHSWSRFRLRGGQRLTTAFHESASDRNNILFRIVSPFPCFALLGQCMNEEDARTSLPCPILA